MSNDSKAQPKPKLALIPVVSYALVEYDEGTQPLDGHDVMARFDGAREMRHYLQSVSDKDSINFLSTPAHVVEVALQLAWEQSNELAHIAIHKGDTESVEEYRADAEYFLGIGSDLIEKYGLDEPDESDEGHGQAQPSVLVPDTSGHTH